MRLFETRLRRENGRKDLNFSQKKDSETWSYRKYAHDLLTSKVDQTERGFPLSPDSDPPAPSELRQKPVFMLTRIEKKGRHTFGEVDYGRATGHDQAVPHADVTGKKPIDITDYSPTRKYRFALILPEAGDVGTLAVEAAAGACPAKYIVQWLRKWSQEQAAKEGASSTVAGKEHPWWKLIAEPIGDPKQLMAFIEENEAESMVLVHRRVADSRLRRDEKFRVEARIESKMSNKVMKAVQKSIKVKSGDGGMANELAALLGDEMEGVEFDDAWVVIDTDLGKRQVSPSRLPDVFTYPIANHRPTDEAFLDEVSRRTLALMSARAASLNLKDL
ncbi:hypothetical protein AZG88_41330 [Rhodococcus sp. LB1]|nr:hypothetical protein AZG88_41330 [Rhodococcus sp. LB1]